MVSHKRLSPGVEVNEIDRSGYDRTDYSITDTTTFVCGFADKGEDYVPTWVNSMDTFAKAYGAPGNEPELYFRQACAEIIERGGSVVAAKLPYVNEKKNSFNAVRFSLGPRPVELSSEALSAEYLDYVKGADSTLTSMLWIDPEPVPLRMTLDRLDEYKTDRALFPNNTFVVVDVSRGDYGVVSADKDYECLGIVPVVVAAGNAMFYQKLVLSGMLSDIWISKDGVDRLVTPGISSYQPVSAVAYCSPSVSQMEFEKRLSADMDFEDIPPAFRDYRLSADNIGSECVSKAAAREFPSILHLAPGRVDRQLLKHVCVAVFAAVKNNADETVEFQLLESYTGSLDRTSKSESGASDYICDVVNGVSRYINVFAHVQTKKGTAYGDAQMLMVRNQRAVSLGFSVAERVK